jgi:hypothetical protein
MTPPPIFQGVGLGQLLNFLLSPSRPNKPEPRNQTASGRGTALAPTVPPARQGGDHQHEKYLCAIIFSSIAISVDLRIYF